MDASDNPHISYFVDIPDKDLRYAYYDGSNWSLQTVDTDGTTGFDTSIALDSSGNPHISYHAYDPLYDLKYAYFDGTEWQVSAVDTDEYVGPYTSIVIDELDEPHIVYSIWNTYDLKYATLEPSIDENDETPNIPTGFELSPVAPNPNDGSATIRFAIPYATKVELALYDIKGRKVAIAASGEYVAGEYSADVSGLSSGIYIYNLNVEGFSDSKKMVVR